MISRGTRASLLDIFWIIRPLLHMPHMQEAHQDVFTPEELEFLFELDQMVTK